jgi:pyruvate-formate lyase-activating enzyme
MVAMLDLLDKLEATDQGAVFPVDGSLVVEGSAQPWAYAALAPVTGRGPAVIKALVKLSSGSMSIGVLSKAQDKFLIEKLIPISGDFLPVEIMVPELADSGGLVLRTFQDGRTRPQLELRQLLLEQQIDDDRDQITVDPIVENLWPLETAVFNIPAMRRWSRDKMKATLTGDAWKDNLILNKWEFATGASRLESFPWRFSVPFVLCNARCEFCSAWLVKGKPMPIDLLDRLDAVLPYLAQIDMVGWGEPLIHPELADILEKFRVHADPRARIALTTNGVHLQKWAERLVAANIRDFAISIHAATGPTHEDLMGLPHGAFEQVLNGIRTIMAYRSSIPDLSVGLVFIVTKQNIDEIPKFIAMAEELGVTSLFLRTLKARTLDEQRKGDLDYQRLPAYLHPDFDGARQRAIEAIAACKMPIEAAPETWSTPIFPPELEEEMLAAPLTPREIRKNSKSFYREPTVDSESLPIGQPAAPGEWLLPNQKYQEVTHERLENPYDRTSPMFCPSPYTALYLNGFDRLVTPCCYMTRVPGHHWSYLRRGASFDDVWNSPAMMTLRRSLNEGPLMQPCLKCAFYW